MAQKRKVVANARSVGEFFRRPVAYRVPPNQRDFAWTQEEIDVLWEDLTQALDDGQEEYFLGAIVLAPGEGEEDFEIVDGQQRLAALSMMLAAIKEAWGKDDRGPEVFDTYLGSRDRRTRETIPKLSLNSMNDIVYQQVVLNGAGYDSKKVKALAKSNRLLIEAYQRIKALLADWTKKQTSGDEALIALEEFIAKNANVIVIEVGDESDAFIIFETLNDRGLELAVSDLVKNYLFSQAGKQIELFKKTWAEIAQTVGSENLTAFLRHFWISEYELLRERELYRALRANIKGSTKPKPFLLRLHDVAQYYAALLTPDHSYWDNVPGSPQKTVRALRLLRAAQFRPLALAVMEGGHEKEVGSMLRIVLAVTLRHAITGKSANELERAYSMAAIAVRKSGKRNAQSVFGHLRSVYISDKEFVEAFAQASFNKADVARFVLGEINHELQDDKSSGVTEEASLEHVMPRNPSGQWKKLPPAEELEEVVGLIGNLTLLEKGTNRRIGSKDFKAKQAEAYTKSQLAINKDLRTPSSWETKDIRERSERLAKLAAKIWRVQL